jgi:hypothetical protein
MKNDQELLKEYVSELLEQEKNVQQEGYDWWYAGTDVLGLGKKKGFLTPFFNVAKTALAGILDIGVHAVGLIKTVIGAVRNSVIPFVKKDLDAINRETKARSEKIRQEFKDVYDHTDSIIKGDDFQVLLFALNPAAYLVGKAAELAKVTVDKTVPQKASLKAAKSKTQSLLDSLLENKAEIKKLISEKASKEQVTSAVNSGEKAQELLAASTSALAARLKSVLDKTNSFDSIKSLEELQQVVGKDLKLKNMEKLKPEDKKTTEEELLDSAKDEYITNMITQLQSELKAIEAVSGRRAQKIVSAYKSAIADLNSKKS